MWVVRDISRRHAVSQTPNLSQDCTDVVSLVWPDRSDMHGDLYFRQDSAEPASGRPSSLGGASGAQSQHSQ
jgi:hypothetical protein